jgi:hypothetical protein
MTHMLIVSPSIDPATKRQRLTLRGPLYDVRYDGVTVLEGTHQPFLDGCRAIQKLGATGPAEMWDTVRPFPRMVGTVEGAAKLTVREPASGGIRFTKWSEWSGEGHSDAP